MSIRMYWLEDSDVPFGPFLGVLQAHYHPEVRHEGFPAMRRRAGRGLPDDGEIGTFKREHVQLLEGNREGLRPRAVDLAAEYDDWDTDDEFLVWVWGELYPGVRLPGGEPRGEVGRCR